MPLPSGGLTSQIPHYEKVEQRKMRKSSCRILRSKKKKKQKKQGRDVAYIFSKSTR